jgi:hypothetical protein
MHRTKLGLTPMDLATINRLIGSLRSCNCFVSSCCGSRCPEGARVVLPCAVATWAWQLPSPLLHVASQMMLLVVPFVTLCWSADKLGITSFRAEDMLVPMLSSVRRLAHCVVRYFVC